MPEDAIVALHPGAVFHGRYRVVRGLKAGGMGAVYEVVDERTDSPRALKIMLASVVADPDLRARFALEAKVTGNIASDHIVRVSDAGIDEATGTPFLVMELLRGREIGSLLAERGPLPAHEVLLYLHQTALALDRTHAAGIVHRDLKPENLFVTYRDDGSPCVKVLDFGVAKVVAEGTAQMTQAVGTPLFMAPEQIRGERSIGPRTDLFALGHIAYTLLTGEAYWKEESTAAQSMFNLFTVLVSGMPEPPSARARRRCGVVLPPRFEGWMLRAVAGRQEERFASASAQVAALAEVLGIPLPGSAFPVISPVPVPVPEISARSGTGTGSSPHASPATERAMVRNAVPSHARSSVPVALGMVVLGALGAWVLFAARSRPAPAAAPAASTAPSAVTLLVSAAPAPSASPIASVSAAPPALSASAPKPRVPVRRATPATPLLSSPL